MVFGWCRNGSWIHTFIFNYVKLIIYHSTLYWLLLLNNNETTLRLFYTTINNSTLHWLLLLSRKETTQRLTFIYFIYLGWTFFLKHCFTERNTNVPIPFICYIFIIRIFWNLAEFCKWRQCVGGFISISS